MPSPNRKPSGSTTAARPWSLQQLDDQRHEEVGGFARAQVGGELVLDAIFFHAAEGRVGDDDVHPVGLAVILVGRRLSMLSCSIWVGVSMPCRIMLVVHSMCGRAFFSTPWMVLQPFLRRPVFT